MERVRIMGGKEASRGFLYQGFASVLEALTDKGNWDKIYVEFPTSNDKVDIALEQQNQIVKCIQVKSTINTFTKSDIKIWLDDLIKDIESPKYELFLIGQCDKSANTFIKSIEKYYGKVLDKEAKSSLNGFDTDLLDNKRIRFFILPFEIEVLEKIVRDSLHQYISDSNQMMTFDQIRFIASATVNDQMISSTHGKGIDRKDFDEEMEKRIFLVADKYSPKRISIGVKSFTRGAENLEKDTESCLSFINKFDGRNIKGEYDWNKDIYRNLEEFLLTNTSNKYAYQIFLDTHASIAFAAGRILDSKSGINVFPIQKSSTNGTVLWDVKLSSKGGLFMSTVPSYFKDFLSNIRLSDNQVKDLKSGHTTLRRRLEEDETLSKIIISTFLQGSYRRSTAVKPKNGNKSDVDVIVVTKLDSEEFTPEEALDLFVPFLEKHYKDKYRIQGRSIGISLSYVDLDIVPTSAPGESETGVLQDEAIISEYTVEDFQQKLLTKSFNNDLLKSAYNIFYKSDNEPQWKSEPLLIPDREAEKWDKTHPLEQIRWTVEKNKNCNTHYINVVKALKWWRKTQYPDMKHPKSYPLEHFIGDCCPDDIKSVAEGVVLTLENIVSQYTNKPFLADRGVPEHDVFARITDEEYSDFYDTVCDAAKIAREAFDCEELYDSVCKWRELFGNEFPPAPKPSKSNSSTGFTTRTEKSAAIPEGRFA